MVKLHQAYRRLVKQLENDYEARKFEMEAWQRTKHKKLHFHEKITRKSEDEV